MQGVGPAAWMEAPGGNLQHRLLAADLQPQILRGMRLRGDTIQAAQGHVGLTSGEKPRVLGW